MAFNFPSYPSEGQVYSGYIFTGGLWIPAPIRTALPFNYIVNPAFQASQQNGNTASAEGAVIDYYPADQWRAVWSFSPGTANTARRSSGAELTPRGNRSVVISCNGVKASLAAGDYIQFPCQFIEGNRITDLQWGTANAKQVMLRFYAKTLQANAAGTYSVSIRNSDATRSFLASFAVTTTWTEFIVPIPGDTTGTWLKDTGVGLNLAFVPACGSTYQGTAGWQAGNKIQISGNDNLADNAGNSFYVGDVGLYADPYLTGKVPPWETPDERQAFVDSKRYFYTIRAARGVTTAATSAARTGATHPVQMRIGPAAAKVGTVTVYDVGSNAAITIATNYPNTYYFEIDGTSTGLTAGRGCNMIASTGKNGMELSARF